MIPIACIVELQHGIAEARRELAADDGADQLAMLPRPCERLEKPRSHIGALRQPSAADVLVVEGGHAHSRPV